MAEEFNSQELLELLKNMWNPMSFPMPGVIAPTVSTEEIDKKIAELRTVENWLKMNLGFLQMSIKTLELQKAAIAALSGDEPKKKP